MIVISEDGRGFEEVRTWDELYSLPGFQQNVDQAAVESLTLNDIIGGYRLPPEKRPCALTTCHQPHFRGYIVKLSGGLVTNLGNVCGLRLFGVEWVEMRNRYKQAYNEYQRRLVIQAAQNRVAPTRDEVITLREGEWGADAIYKKMHRQCGVLFDGATQEKLAARAKAQNNVVNRVTRRTAEELEDARAIGDRNEFNEQYVFTIAGVGAYRGYKRLRTLAEEKLGAELEQFATLNVDTLDSKSLRQWSKWSEDMDNNLREARNILEDCIRFLQPENIRLINAHRSLL